MLRDPPNAMRAKRLTFETLEGRALLTVLMTPQEQLFIELINRARADPLAEVARNPAVDDLNQDVEEDEQISPDPKQPLAPHQALTDATISHVLDMLARNFFAHDNPDGESPSDRARDAGYPTGAGENIAWSGNTRSIDRNGEVYGRHDGLFESVGHRINMMRDNWREIGAGIRYGSFTNDSVEFRESIMAGTLFGNRGGESFITGVAIDDSVAVNNFYDINEGIRDVLITVINTETEEVYSVRTGPSGGYALQVPNGSYTMSATGGNLNRPLLVGGVYVDGENVKVDFNSRSMDTRFLQGQSFEDTDGNNRRTQGEPTLAGRTIYLDLNDNEQLDAGEPTQVTDASGTYQFENLLPKEYVVRQILPAGWEQPVEGAFFVDVAQQSLVGLDYPSREIDFAPIANNDFTQGFANEDISINVLQNDSDPDGSLNTNSVQITSPPRNGEASVIGNSIVYRANSQFTGTDFLTYTVRDETGQSSNVATVSIEVISGSPWQNPAVARDVDNDGFVIPRDVLALVSEINTNGSRSLANTVRTAGSFYFDVNGDSFLSPIDVLFVVTFLNGDGSGEPPEPTSPSSQFAAADLVFATMTQQREYEQVDDDESEDVDFLLA